MGDTPKPSVRLRRTLSSVIPAQAGIHVGPRRATLRRGRGTQFRCLSGHRPDARHITCRSVHIRGVSSCLYFNPPCIPQSWETRRNAEGLRPSAHPWGDRIGAILVIALLEGPNPPSTPKAAASSCATRSTVHRRRPPAAASPRSAACR